jgi:hypothetical protein
MTLGDLVDEIISSLAADGIPPFPGFFTLVTIANAVLSRGWEGKRQTVRSGQSSLSRGQLLAIRRYLDDYYEVKRSGRLAYYGGNKRGKGITSLAE